MPKKDQELKVSIHLMNGHTIVKTFKNCVLIGYEGIKINFYNCKNKGITLIPGNTTTVIIEEE